MTESDFKRGVACGVVFTVMVTVGLLYIADNARQRAIGLYEDSLAAVRDTSRELKLEVGVLADGLTAEQRRSVQAKQTNDSLDRALKLERKAHADVTGHVATAVVADSGLRVTAAADTSTRKAPFEIRQEPYTIKGTVELPAPPASGTLHLTIVQDPVSIDFRLHCGQRSASGIRPASLTATAPDWFHLKIGEVSQDPSVCNPPSAPARAWRTSWTTLAGLRDRAGLWFGVTFEGRAIAAAGVRAWP